VVCRHEQNVSFIAAGLGKLTATPACVWPLRVPVVRTWRPDLRRPINHIMVARGWQRAAIPSIHGSGLTTNVFREAGKRPKVAMFACMRKLVTAIHSVARHPPVRPETLPTDWRMSAIKNAYA
jgi:hypothetical protein